MLVEIQHEVDPVDQNLAPQNRSEQEARRHLATADR
jgi:hypothetical protein